MKNTFGALIFASVLAFTAVPPMTQAAGISFFNALSPGSTGASVSALQAFLIDGGYLTIAPTGVYSSATQKAVIAFQKEQGIPANGAFDADTMANANARLQLAAAKAPATVAIQGISTSPNTASVIGAVSKTIAWKTSAYPNDTGIDINLIRKTSDSPASYSFVKKIGKNVSNAGTYQWTPTASETGADLYVEVACSSSVTALADGCKIVAQPISL